MSLRRTVFPFLLLSICVYAQFETAVVLGTVRDPSQSVISAAKVTLSNIDTGIITSADTDETGSYLFPNVKPGRYKVSAEKAGFSIALTSVATICRTVTRPRRRALSRVGGSRSSTA